MDPENIASPKHLSKKSDSKDLLDVVNKARIVSARKKKKSKMNVTSPRSSSNVDSGDNKGVSRKQSKGLRGKKKSGQSRGFTPIDAFRSSGEETGASGKVPKK